MPLVSVTCYIKVNNKSLRFTLVSMAHKSRKTIPSTRDSDNKEHLQNNLI
jgi:hypothetical protein